MLRGTGFLPASDFPCIGTTFERVFDPYVAVRDVFFASVSGLIFGLNWENTGRNISQILLGNI